MLIIKPVQEKETQKTYCDSCNIPYQSELMAYAAHVDGELVGICAFSMDNERGWIHQLAKAQGTDDNEAMFIMGRQTLNFIDQCGVHLAEFLPQQDFDEHLIRWIGFAPDENGRWIMDLTDFFNEPCQHKKN